MKIRQYKLHLGSKPSINKGARATVIMFVAAMLTQALGSAAWGLQTLSFTEKPFTTTELGNWHTDRATPSGGYGIVDYGSRSEVLEMNINKDAQSTLGSFYYTEGLQRLIPVSDSVRADVYVDGAWAGKTVRAGLWAVGYDSANAVSSYPIIEYTTDGFTGWRIWNVNAWLNLPGVAANQNAWNNLVITHNAVTHTFDYSVNGAKVASSDDEGSANIQAVILNSKNYGSSADSYSAHWSKFGYGSYVFTPETPTNTAFSNPAGCGGSTSISSTVASWSPVIDATSFNYKAWKDGDPTYNSLATAYTVNGLTTTSRAGSFSLGEGKYYFAVQAVYAGGQKSDWSAPCAATYDVTAPTSVSIQTPVERQWFKTTPIFDSWTASQDQGGLKNYQIAYRYDDGHTFGASTCVGETISGLAVSGCRDTTTTSRNHIPGTNEQGGVSIWVRAIDKAGNKSAWSKPVHYYYDSTAPTGDITYPGNASTIESVNGKIDVRGTVHDNLSMNRVGVQLFKPGVSGQIQFLYDHMVNTNPGTWEVQFDAAALKLANGTYGLNLQFVDMAGNVTTKSTTFTLANPIPALAAEDFGIGSWTLKGDGFTGINVGFNTHSFATYTGITVDLYDQDGKVDTNTASADLLTMLNENRIGPSLSTPFATKGEVVDTYCDGNACWNLGGHEWEHDSKTPIRTVITVTGTDAYGQTVSKTVENTNFTEAAATFASILPGKIVIPAKPIIVENPVATVATTQARSVTANTPASNNNASGQNPGSGANVLGETTTTQTPTSTPTGDVKGASTTTAAAAQQAAKGINWSLWAIIAAVVLLGTGAWWFAAARSRQD